MTDALLKVPACLQDTHKCVQNHTKYSTSCFFDSTYFKQSFICDNFTFVIITRNTGEKWLSQFMVGYKNMTQMHFCQWQVINSVAAPSQSLSNQEPMSLYSLSITLPVWDPAPSEGVVLSVLWTLLARLDVLETAVCTHAARLAICSSILSIRNL